MNRRAFLATTGLAAVGALAACATTTSNGTTTLTLDTAKVDSYAQAALSGITLVASLPGITGTPQAAAVTALAPVVSADLKAFDASTNGALTLTFTAASVPAAVQSVLNDINTVLAAVRTAVTQVGTAQMATAQTYVDALQTIYAVFTAAVGTPVAGVALSSKPMTEAQALATLQVR
jgi:hypothetical protein